MPTGADPQKLAAVQAYLEREFTGGAVDLVAPHDDLVYRFRVRDPVLDVAYELHVWRRVLDDHEPAAVGTLLAARDIAGRLRAAGGRVPLVLSGRRPDDVYEEA